jgi:uncharacterized membrane protein YdcZ (DUF606 family)
LDLHTYSVKWSNDFYIMIRVQWVGLILSSRMISFLFGTFFFLLLWILQCFHKTSPLIHRSITKINRSSSLA